MISLMDFVFYFALPIISQNAKDKNTFDYSMYLYSSDLIFYISSFLILIMTYKTSIFLLLS